MAFMAAWEGELGFWLRRAPVVDGNLVETEELAAMRAELERLHLALASDTQAERARLAVAGARWMLGETENV